MKKLLFITVFLVAVTANLSAQNKNNVKIKKIESNQFKITADEEMDVNLRFNLEPIEDYHVIICDDNMNVLSLKKNLKKGENKIAFTIEEGEEYIVKFIGINSIKLVDTRFAHK